jgi:hypothetical protein
MFRFPFAHTITPKPCYVRRYHRDPSALFPLVRMSEWCLEQVFSMGYKGNWGFLTFSVTCLHDSGFHLSLWFWKFLSLHKIEGRDVRERENSEDKGKRQALVQDLRCRHQCLARSPKSNGQGSSASLLLGFLSLSKWHQCLLHLSRWYPGTLSVPSLPHPHHHQVLGLLLLKFLNCILSTATTSHHDL